MVTVELTQHLYQFFPDLRHRRLVVKAATVADVVKEVDKLAPGLAFYLCDERGRLRQHVNIFVQDEMLTDRVHLTDRVDPNGRVLIVQALSGG